MFCYPESIDREMSKLFGSLARQKHFRGLTAEQFAAMAAHFLAGLNAIHPFREGNGRSQLTFLTLIAAIACHPLAIERLDPDMVMRVMIESFGGEEKSLADIILELAR